MAEEEGHTASGKIFFDEVSLLLKGVNKKSKTVTSRALSPLALKYLLANSAVRCNDVKFAYATYKEIIAKNKTDRTVCSHLLLPSFFYIISTNHK
jgi:hypothetical protein